MFLSTNYQSGDILVKIGDFGLARSVQNNTTNAAFRERGKIHDLIGMFLNVTLCHSIFTYSAGFPNIFLDIF